VAIVACDGDEVAREHFVEPDRPEAEPGDVVGDESGPPAIATGLSPCLCLGEILPCHRAAPVVVVEVKCLEGPPARRLGGWIGLPPPQTPPPCANPTPRAPGYAGITLEGENTRTIPS